VCRSFYGSFRAAPSWFVPFGQSGNSLRSLASGQSSANQGPNAWRTVFVVRSGPFKVIPSVVCGVSVFDLKVAAA
jgi:hypothetical protein